MLAFNEGVPGSGKSYDAVREHIIPALIEGRHVAARLNGLNSVEIAKYLTRKTKRVWHEGEVEELLELVPSDQVASRFVAEQNESGEWVLPADLQNKLVIIDECHEFYVASRQPLPPHVEQFFAMHRHYGVDVVLMSQFYKRLHSAVRGRIERKSVFQKLSAVGFDSKYQVTFFTTIAPDKYEKVGASTRGYESEVFPLYQGVKPGAKTEVYEGGARSAWRQLLVPALIVIPLGVAAAGYAVWFLTGGAQESFAGTGKPKAATVGAVAPVSAAALPENMSAPGAKPAHQVDQASTRKAVKAPPAHAGLTVEQRYVFTLSDNSRPRLAAQFSRGDDQVVLVEWRDGANNPYELLNSDQLKALGVDVVVTPYGAQLQAGNERMVVTRWPTNAPIREQEPRLYNLDGNGGAMPSFALPSTSSASSSSSSAPNIGENYKPLR